MTTKSDIVVLKLENDLAKTQAEYEIFKKYKDRNCYKQMTTA